MAQVELRLGGNQLLVPPFLLSRGHQRYRQPGEIRIDLSGLEPDLYRVVAVQNFWIEDGSPDLSEALAGVFLARRRADGAWEEAENWPIECRTLALLGHVDLRRADCCVLLPP
ncbi:MAG TPA: hypothetical protein VMK32_10910 [Burkholderiaceae bacterium]|nr:hypothetical protein [Burkholderiaceae bacterium]